MPESKALTREEILHKLNDIPVFCILNSDGGIVGMRANEEETPSCCWFVDALEARALLKASIADNPDAGLHLAVHGFGAVFTKCGGWGSGDGDEPEATAQSGEPVLLKIKGRHELVEEVGPRLQELLKQNFIDPGCWVLPVFFCDELQSKAIVPVFLSPADLAATWAKARGADTPVPEALTLMDIRMLV